MGAPTGLQFSIALCIGMVAATFAPSVRRSIPRWFEAAMWAALIVVCVLGVMSIRDPRARELTTAVNWAGAQILNTLLGLVGSGFVDMVSTHRYPIAVAVVVIFGVALIALALISSHRLGRGWQPQVRLRDWMELPPAPAPAPAVASVVPSGIDELNETTPVSGAPKRSAAIPASTRPNAASTPPTASIIDDSSTGIPRAGK